MVTIRTMLPLVFSWIVCLSALTVLLAEPPASEKSESKSGIRLPDPPARIADAAVQAKTCVECHQEIADLLKGDKHIADDFHCVVCHGPSKAHLEMEKEGTLPDRAWRRWLEDQNRFQWRTKNASLEIAMFCASCHGRKQVEGENTKRIGWEDYLATKHGVGVSKGDHDAATCTDCHEAHGAGRSPWTDKTIVQRCAVCHGDKEMAKRAGLDPNVIEDFKAGKHGDMGSAPAEKKASCIKCHHPH